MAAFDYERCWGELLLLLEEDARPNWGARQLREEMSRIMGRNQRPLESGVAQMLRLHGIEVDAAALIEFLTQRASGPTSQVAEGSLGTGLAGARAPSDQEVIDERRTAGYAGEAADVDGAARGSRAA